MCISTGNYDSIFFLWFTPFLNFEICRNERFYWNSPLKPLSRISWNFVVMKDIMCRCANFVSIFFLGVTSFLNLEIWPKWKILLKQFVSATPLIPLNRISWSFVVMKDIVCRYAFYRKCWFDPFKEQFIPLFLSDCPSQMLGIAIHCIQHS